MKRRSTNTKRRRRDANNTILEERWIQISCRRRNSGGTYIGLLHYLYSLFILLIEGG
jgi:hypothetical protein